MQAISTAQMQRADRLTVKRYGIPVLLLMENAGRAVAIATRQMMRRTGDKRVLIFCGNGNNGGDGVVAARYLQLWGYRVQVVWIKNPRLWEGDLAQHYRMAKAVGVPFRSFGRASRSAASFRLARSGTVMIDALLGTGVKGEIHGSYREAIKLINGSHCPMVAVDIPSGLDADSGKPLGIAVKAKMTVTMAAAKTGLVTSAARPYVGKLRIAEIGIPQALLIPY